MTSDSGSRTSRAPAVWLVFALSLGPAVSNGLGRFAYALILPAMRSDLGWSYTQAGWVNTANALGYLAGALLTLRLVRLTGAHKLYGVGMLSTAAALLASGLVRSYAVLLGLRFVAGAGGALAFIAGGVLVAELFAQHPERAPASIALYFGGGGLGILLSGATLPWLFLLRGGHAWDEAWLGCGALAAALCVPSLAAAARVPAMQLRSSVARFSKRALWPSLAGYFIFAIGSIIYMTFIVAWMRARGAGAGDVALVWSALGLAILVSPVPWRVPLSRLRGGLPLALATAGCALGAALPLVSTSLPAMLASATLFGLCFFIPPAAVTALSRASLQREAWGAGIATYTVAFGLGQPIGPYVAGAVADAAGTLFSGLLAAVGLLLAGALVAALQRPVSAEAASR